MPPPKKTVNSFTEKGPIPTLPADFAAPPKAPVPPAPKAASGAGGAGEGVDKSPAISPRSAPRWGTELPPALDLAAAESDAPAVSTEEAVSPPPRDFLFFAEGDPSTVTKIHQFN